MLLLKLSRVEGRHAWHKSVLGVVLVAVAVGAGPVACLSDIALPDCEARGVSCHVDVDAGGEAGESGGSATPSGGFSNGGEAAALNNPAGGDAAGSRDDTAGSGGEVAGGAGEVAGSDAGGHGGNGGGKSLGGGAGGASTCVACEITPDALPAPCQSNPYSTTLNIVGKTPPFTWRLVPPSDRWSLTKDPGSPSGAKVTLSGQPAGPTSVTIEVTDAVGGVLSKSLEIKPRSTCWFAYTAVETAGPRLELLDPILQLPPPAPPAHNDGVYDFQFSPNGQYLAYRFGADATYPNGRHLSILSLSTWTEKVLTLSEDAITAFSWSKDSIFLAVAFQSGNVGYLGGVSLPSGGASTFPANIETLSPVAALVDSSLYWAGGRNLAFDATILLSQATPPVVLPNPNQRRTPYYSVLGDTGFAQPVAFPRVNYPPSVFLQATDKGFFMTAAVPSTNFYSLPGGVVARHQSIDLVAPSGSFSAQLNDGQLQVFDATKGNLVDPPYTSAAGEDCPKLLAWAKGVERIACVANVASDPPGATHGEVRIFDIEPPATLALHPLAGYCVKDSSALPTVSSCGRLEYDYTEESSAVQARAFSPSGRWFAFTAQVPDPGIGAYLYWADLSSEPTTLKQKFYVATSSMASASPSALVYSADDRFLLSQFGSSLIAYDLSTSGPIELGSTAADVTEDLLTGTSQATSPCSEEYPSAPARWCGTADRDLPFVWAPDSRYAAYREQGQIIVVDLTHFYRTAPHQFVAADCGQQCAHQFAFQPQP